MSEVRLFWSFIKAVAVLKDRLQQAFNINLDEIERPFIKVANQYDYNTVRTITTHDWDHCNTETIELTGFMVAWHGRSIPFRCGYGKDSNTFVYGIGNEIVV